MSSIRFELTAREWTILAMVAQGESSIDIGELLNISPKTVEAHRSNILRRLKARSSAHAVAIAYKYGLWDLSEVDG